MEVSEDLPLLAEEIERNREEGANEKKPQKTVVDGSGTEHLLGSKGAPGDGSCEGGIDRRTSEAILLLGCANTGDLLHLVVESSRAHERGNKRGEDLAAERDPRWNVDVVG